MGQTHFVVAVLGGSLIALVCGHAEAAMPQVFFGKSAARENARTDCGTSSGWQSAQSAYGATSRTGCDPRAGLQQDFRGAMAFNKPAGSLGGYSPNSGIAQTTRSASFNQPVSESFSGASWNSRVSAPVTQLSKPGSINTLADYRAERFEHFDLPVPARVDAGLSRFNGSGPAASLTRSGSVSIMSGPIFEPGPILNLNAGSGSISTSFSPLSSLTPLRGTFAQAGTLTISNLSGPLFLSDPSPAVPEPASLALLAIGGVFLPWRRRAAR
jgi:hypothetical protein